MGALLFEFLPAGHDAALIPILLVADLERDAEPIADGEVPIGAGKGELPAPPAVDRIGHGQAAFVLGSGSAIFELFALVVDDSAAGPIPDREGLGRGGLRRAAADDHG